VAQGDPVNRTGGEELFEKSVSGAAGGLFQVVPGFGGGAAHIECTRVHNDAQSGGKVVDKLGILAGFLSPQHMVQVEHRERDVKDRGEFEEDVQKSDRVGTAGDSHTHALAGGEHLVAPDGGEDALGHDFRVAGHFRPFERELHDIMGDVISLEL
jgi:hypothetical protein